MASSRFFLANLPTSTTENDLKEVFQDYGQVTKVEIKTKENISEPGNFTTIGFVTLVINAADVKNCLNELQWRKVKGTYLKVALAKESFLERLKREREEDGKPTKVNIKNEVNTVQVSCNAKLPTEGVNTHKKFADDLELSEEDDCLLISKKRAATSLHNGKIVIRSSDAEPIHVINSKPTVRQLDTKTAAADRKRKIALDQKKKQYNLNKIVIQQDLANENRKAKKIKFEDSEIDAGVQLKAERKTNIFGSDLEDETESFTSLKLKPEYVGRKGEKLLELQCKQSWDPRFKLGAKFVDGEENSDDCEVRQEETATERDWQMGILEQVVSTKMEPSTNLNKKSKTMLRFDPSKSDHSKFLRHRDNEPVKGRAITQKNAGEKEKDVVENTAPAVSKEVFYTVGENLTELLKTRGDGFSLLKMFGISDSQGDDKRGDNLKKLTKEKIVLNKVDKSAFNAFSYDSSSEGAEDERITTSAMDTPHNKPKKSSTGKQKLKSFVESFFIPKNDPRLKEGSKFFKYEKKPETNEAYEEKRKRLKMLIRTKISKSKKQLIGDRRKSKKILIS